MLGVKNQTARDLKMYQSQTGVIGAYKEILKHWKALYEISKYNRLQGVKPWPLQKGRKFLSDTNKHIKMMKEVDERIG